MLGSRLVLFTYMLGIKSQDPTATHIDNNYSILYDYVKALAKVYNQTLQPEKECLMSESLVLELLNFSRESTCTDMTRLGC